MKAAILPLALLVCFQPLKARSLPEIVTLDGRRFVGCEQVRVHPDGVSFRHAHGVAKVLFTDLPAESRARLGYDPARARAYEKELAARREEEKAARARQAEAAARAEEARYQALAAAAQRDHLRSLGQEAQARAAALRAAGQAQASSVPVLPELGAVFIPSGGCGPYARPGWVTPWQGGFFTPVQGWPGYYPGLGCRPQARRTSVMRLTLRP